MQCLCRGISAHLRYHVARMVRPCVLPYRPPMGKCSGIPLSAFRRGYKPRVIIHRFAHRAQAHAIRGYSSFQRTNDCSLFRGNATSLSNAALIRKGVFYFFSIFFRAAKWRHAHMYYAHIGIMIRAYTKVFPNCQ